MNKIKDHEESGFSISKYVRQSSKAWRNAQTSSVAQCLKRNSRRDTTLRRVNSLLFLHPYNYTPSDFTFYISKLSRWLLNRKKKVISSSMID